MQRHLFIAPKRRWLAALGYAAATILMVVVLGGLGNALDSARNSIELQPTYAGYGYSPSPVATAVARAIAASQAQDQRQCEALHGPQAVAMQLPDGQHRCADKHGRMLSRRSAITIRPNQFEQVAR